MRIRPYTILAVSASAAVGVLTLSVACNDYKPWVDPDTVHFDAGVDYSLAPQVTHIGPNAVTCCVRSLGSGAAFYLVNPTPGGTDRRGNPKPPDGELHLATPFGVDYTLGQNVMAFGYGFAPDGQTAFYLTPTNDANMTYALNAIRVTLPDLKQPTPKVVLKEGFDSGSSLGGQTVYTPSGNYMIAFPHGGASGGEQQSFEAHVVSVRGGEDVANLGFVDLYNFQVTFDDVLIYDSDEASQTPGTPSVEGLYMLNLQAAQSGAQRVKIDQHVGLFALTADSTTLVYQRVNGDLVLWDLKDQDYSVIAHNVVNFSLGPQRNGPFVWMQSDLSLHVGLKQRPELITLPAGSIDIESPIWFSDDGQHMYYFKNVSLLSNYGDLYHVPIPTSPLGASKAPPVTPNLVATRASLYDLYWTNGTFLYMKDISNTGDTGDLVSAYYDGSNSATMASGVATGELQIAYPQPALPTPQRPGGFYPKSKAPDLSVVAIPPVLANLTNATRDTDTTKLFVNSSSRPVLGSLAFGGKLGQAELVIADSVHAGQYQFSDDGYVLLYVSDAQYAKSAFNYVGKMQLTQTNNNIGPTVPMLEGVAEMGPISERALFVSAPGAATPGMYYVKY